MTTRYKDAPEVIAEFREIDQGGEDYHYGEKITCVQVRVESKDGPAILQIDVHDARARRNAVIEIELQEFVAALSLATLNATKEA